MKRKKVSRRVDRREMDAAALGAVDAVDSSIMTRVLAILTPFDEMLGQACLDRKLLPHKLACAIERARLLARVLVPARAAQELSGVPASMLVAEFWFGSNEADVGDIPVGNDCFGTGRRFESIEGSFLDHARRLAKNPKFRAVLRAVGNPVKYRDQVGRCKLWDKLGRIDRVEFFDSLKECDAVPGGANY